MVLLHQVYNLIHFTYEPQLFKFLLCSKNLNDYFTFQIRKKERKKVKSLSRVWLFATPWTDVAHQAPPSMGFSRQEYWSGLPFASPGDLPDPGIEPKSPALQADTLTSEPPGKPRQIFRLEKLVNPVTMIFQYIWAQLLKI